MPKFDRSNTEDLIQGNYHGVEFRIFECELEEVIRTKDTVRYSSVLRGLLFRFDFPKEFRGRTLALKDGGTVSNFLRDLKIEGQRVKLEDPRFEELFEVWGDDQIQARSLLPPTFME